MNTASPATQAHQLQNEHRDDEELWTKALGVLRANSLGHSTKPAPGLYPHQWLWDSCFIGIGLRHIDVQRAQDEIISLFAGQWTNGMLPHIIFSGDPKYYAGPQKWRSDLIKAAPRGVATTGITQPPLVAEAIIRIGEKLSDDERIAFYKRLFPNLVRYHQWLYRERDPRGSGLVTLVHPWESGLDNTPYWMVLTEDAAPMRVRALRTINQDEILGYMRKDKKLANPDERLTAADLYTLYHILTQIRRVKYKFTKMLWHNHNNIPLVNHIPLVEDVVFNAILIRANEHLRTIATELGTTLPADLQEAIEKSPHAFETLYSNSNYWSREFRTGKLIKVPTIGTFLALYAGTIPQKHADMLAEELQKVEYWSNFGIATVPANSPYFRPRRYWQGPVWVNMNWLIADGLDRYGHHDVAEKLRQQTIKVVREHGFFEYFSPLDGKGAGTDNFSWTAALTIDMLARQSHAIIPSTYTPLSEAIDVTLSAKV